MFEVTITGQYLTGEERFLVRAGEEYKYILIFNPHSPQKIEGSIYFVSEKLGEQLY
jgi:hypothetical protein